MAARSWWIGWLLLGMFFAIYIPVIRGEEELLRQKFPEFDEYARQVPRMFPGLGYPGARQRSRTFSADLYRQHREYQALLGAIGMMGALAMKLVWVARR
jgi:hypothetical protein